MFKEILAFYDFSIPSRRALEWSLKLGERFHSSLKIIHVSIRKESPEMIERIREEVIKTVQTLASGLELKKPEIKVCMGSVVPSLLSIIEKESPSLVVLGTHGRTGLDHVLLGSVTEKIARYSPSPVFIVRKSSPWPPKTLLVPIDFVDADKSLKESMLLADLFCQSIPVRIELLHVISRPDLVATVPASLEGYGSIDQEKMTQSALTKLNEIISMYPSLKISPHVSIGPIANEICQTAKKFGSDLILIPTHARSGLGRLFLGNVAEHVIRYAPCHVLSFCPKKDISYRLETIQELEEDFGKSEVCD